MSTLKTTMVKLSLVALAVSTASCSFKEDRQNEVVPIVDASPAKTTPKRPSTENKQQTIYQYIVQPGDTLGTIAQEYLGSSSRYKELLTLNKLDTNDSIYVGQKLKLPTEGLTIPTQSSQSTTTPRETVDAEVNKQEYPELNQLLANEQYNQAINWLLNNPKLPEEKSLQDKLADTALLQADAYQRAQRDSDAETLLSGLIQNEALGASEKNKLQARLQTLQAERQLLTAKKYADEAKYDQSYDILLDAWNKVGSPLEENILFTTTRNKVSEHYHQQALRLYRNQKLNDALLYWEKILVLNPNDDLALVYTDRVKALQNKLDNL